MQRKMASAFGTPSKQSNSEIRLLWMEVTVPNEVMAERMK